jgi:hypothetical protein
MRVTGPYAVSTTLTAFDESIVAGDCFASITGIGDYFFTHKLLPRTAADLVLGTDEQCLPAENSLEVCQDDGLDNDHNGYADCDDVACQLVVAECLTDATLAQVQAGMFEPDTRVRITDAVVVGKAFNKRAMWIQDDPEGGAEPGGVFVFGLFGGENLPDELALGDRVTVSAAIVEFDCGGMCADNPLTELSSAVLEARTPGDPLAAPAVALDAAMGEAFEGRLVTLENVTSGTLHEFKSESGSVLSREYAISAGGKTIYVDDDIFRVAAAPPLGTCQTITGIMHFNTSDNSDEGDDETDGGLPRHVTILPRAGADIVAGSGCVE